MAKTSRGIIVLAASSAILPWIIAPLTGVRDPWTDFKWVALAVLVAVIAGLFLHEFAGRKNFRSANFRAIAAFLAGCAMILSGLALSAAASPVPGMAVRILLREIPLIGLALSLAFRGAREREVRLILLALLASGLVQSALVVAQFFGIMTSGGANGRASMLGTFGNPEHVAGWLAPLATTAFAWLAARPADARLRMFLLASATGSCLAIILSGGRGAALSAAASMGILCWFVGDRRRIENAPGLIARRMKSFAAAGAGLMLLVLMGAFTPSLRQTLPGRLAETLNPYSISVRHRIGLMTVTSRMIFENPVLGAGPGLFPVAFDRNRGRLARESENSGSWVFNEIMSDFTATEAHCDPLQWWAEYGLLPFLGLVLVISSTLDRLRRADGAAGIRLESRMILAAILTMAIGMFFSFPLHRPARALIFWMLVGLGQGLDASGQSALESPDNGKPC